MKKRDFNAEKFKLEVLARLHACIAKSYEHMALTLKNVKPSQSAIGKN